MSENVVLASGVAPVYAVECAACKRVILASGKYLAARLTVHDGDGSKFHRIKDWAQPFCNAACVADYISKQPEYKGFP